MEVSVLIFFLVTFWTAGTAAKYITNELELAELKETVLDLSEKLQTLNISLHADDPAMFYAVMRSRAFSLNIDTILVFETVIVNEGGHYNPNNGVFLSPKRGIYLFSWTSSSYGGHQIATELVVEDTVISATGKYNSHGGYYSGSMTALCKMEKDGHAWIRTTGLTSSHYVYTQDNYPQTGFLGLFVQNI